MRETQTNRWDKGRVRRRDRQSWSKYPNGNIEDWRVWNREPPHTRNDQQTRRGQQLSKIKLYRRGRGIQPSTECRKEQIETEKNGSGKIALRIRRGCWIWEIDIRGFGQIRYWIRAAVEWIKRTY